MISLAYELVHLSTIGLAVYAAVGCLAIQFSTPGMRITTLSTAGIVDLLLLLSIVPDLELDESFKYRRNFYEHVPDGVRHSSADSHVVLP